MNILYLHGLNSKLSEAKQKILETYGKVYAPEIAYENRHISPLEILEQYRGTEFNVIIGSSMGALNAYIIAENIGRPALLFNPPLKKYEKIKFKTFYTRGLASKNLLLGAEDDIVNPAETLDFIGKNSKNAELNISIKPGLGHRIPLEIFREEVSIFFSKHCY